MKDAIGLILILVLVLAVLAMVGIVAISAETEWRGGAKQRHQPRKQMIGNILSTVIRVATLPIDAASAATDILTGGDGSKESRTDGGNPFGMLEEIRDAVADTAKEINQ